MMEERNEVAPFGKAGGEGKMKAMPSRRSMKAAARRRKQNLKLAVVLVVVALGAVVAFLLGTGGLSSALLTQILWNGLLIAVGVLVILGIKAAIYSIFHRKKKNEDEPAAELEAAAPENKKFPVYPAISDDRPPLINDFPTFKKPVGEFVPLDLPNNQGAIFNQEVDTWNAAEQPISSDQLENSGVNADIISENLSNGLDTGTDDSNFAVDNAEAASISNNISDTLPVENNDADLTENINPDLWGDNSPANPYNPAFVRNSSVKHRETGNTIFFGRENEHTEKLPSRRARREEKQYGEKMISLGDNSRTEINELPVSELTPNFAPLPVEAAKKFGSETAANQPPLLEKNNPFDNFDNRKETVPTESFSNRFSQILQETPQESGSKQNAPVENNSSQRYVLPQVPSILDTPVKRHPVDLLAEIDEKTETLARTLDNFRVSAKIVNTCHGPAVTRFEVEPAPGVKVSKITGLADDIALALAAPSVRIEPVPGKAVIGIEVPNAELEGVSLREVLDTSEFSEAESNLTCGIGVDISGAPVFADIVKMPHLLVAGATGSGKSVCINTLIASILFKARPDEVRLILIDPKRVELSNYNGIPHLLLPVVTDLKKAAAVLHWAVQETERRYKLFMDNSVRDITRFNHLAKTDEEKLPSIIIIIDELAELMMAAPNEVEDSICRIAQMARAAGIHLVLATQRPSVDVITGLIKANITSRISFAVSSQVDSRTILDTGGAEKLLGRGDMLFRPFGLGKPRRVQGAFLSDDELDRLLAFIKKQDFQCAVNEELLALLESDDDSDDAEMDDMAISGGRDELLEKAAEIVISAGAASVSLLKRKLRVGHSRAGRLIDTLEELGIVSPQIGDNKPRVIMVTQEEADEILGL